MSERPYVGGQAVIEGVMMRGPRSLAIAVRRPGGEIVIKDSPWRSIWERYAFLRWPFFRGSIVLLETLINGIQALSFSAEQASIENANEATGDQGSPGLTGFAMYGTLAIALAFAIGLFVVLPHLLTLSIGWMSGIELDVNSIWFHIIDGGIKAIIFLVYVFSIGLLPDIRRVLMYHGAEHKTIYTYENHEELVVENARRHSTRHPRCGTAFLLIVIFISIIVFALAFVWLPPLTGNRVADTVIVILIKLPLLFPVGGIAYEYQRFVAKRMGSTWVKALAWPGLAMQGLTTREPTDDQLEVAIASMKQALWREAAGPEAKAPVGSDELIHVRDYMSVGAE
ncbi:MAG: DUF1385 domain-containing protein [Deltaproteobacteria bacterium]|nr:DUF1385 domain-containing protein [Deltaproteobacteria bacterium]